LKGGARRRSLREELGLREELELEGGV